MANPSPPSRLPLELYRTIVANVADRSDLYSLLLTCRAFHHEAERALFQHLLVQDDPRPLQRITSEPRLANLVIALDLTIGLRIVLPVANSALRAATRIRSLRLDFVPGSGVAVLEFLVEGVTFKLHHFSFKIGMRLAARKFFASQTEITKLDLSGNETSVPHEVFKPSSHPHLTTVGLGSPASAVLPLVSGRSGIVRLRARITTVERIDDSTSLRALSIRGTYRTPSFTPLHTKFPNITYISTRCNTVEEMEEIARENTNLIRLCFELHPPDSYASNTDDLAEFLLNTSSSLDTLVLWGPLSFWRQYRRGTKQFTNITFDFDEWSIWSS